jgi:mono/diheme cytochrome c family protein
MRWLVLAMLLIGPQAMAAEATDTLAPGPGHDTAAVACATCHTVDYIRMNSSFMTPDVWKAEVTKMRTAFGAPIDNDAAAEILTYLAAHYAVPAKSP